MTLKLFFIKAMLLKYMLGTYLYEYLSVNIPYYAFH
jgi:hypothetical protein